MAQHLPHMSGDPMEPMYLWKKELCKLVPWPTCIQCHMPPPPACTYPHTMIIHKTSKDEASHNNTSRKNSVPGRSQTYYVWPSSSARGYLEIQPSKSEALLIETRILCGFFFFCHRFTYFILCVFLCLSVCMCITTCVQIPVEDKRMGWITCY